MLDEPISSNLYVLDLYLNQAKRENIVQRLCGKIEREEIQRSWKSTYNIGKVY
jgi:hypothetical protein